MPFLPLMSTLTISLGELSGLLRRAEALLRARRKAVLRLARELRLHDEVLGVPAGVLARERVVEAVAQHAVVDLGGAHAIAPAAAVHQVRRAVHVLHAARDRDIDLAGRDLLGRRDDGLRAGAADAVHREGGTDTGTPPPIEAWRAGFILLPAWTTLPITTLPTAAGSRPARLECFADHHGAEVGRGRPLSEPL